MESFRKFCPLCYKQVIALSPRRIKDKFSLVFSKFSQIALVAATQAICGNFINTRENLSLILLGLMRLHILNQCLNVTTGWFPGKREIANFLFTVHNNNTKRLGCTLETLFLRMILY